MCVRVSVCVCVCVWGGGGLRTCVRACVCVCVIKHKNQQQRITSLPFYYIYTHIHFCFVFCCCLFVASLLFVILILATGKKSFIFHNTTILAIPVSTLLEEVYRYCIVFQILQRESWMEAVRVQAKVHARIPTQSVPAPQPRNVPVKAGIRQLVARAVSVFFFCMTPAGSRFYQYCSP